MRGGYNSVMRSLVSFLCGFLYASFEVRHLGVAGSPRTRMGICPWARCLKWLLIDPIHPMYLVLIRDCHMPGRSPRAKIEYSQKMKKVPSSPPRTWLQISKLFCARERCTAYFFVWMRDNAHDSHMTDSTHPHVSP